MENKHLTQVTQTELIAWLSTLLKIDTTNPPGNEAVAAKYIFNLLLKEGLEPQILESDSERANVYLRLEGSEKNNSLLLLSHLDVVPAQKNEWKMDPFSGVIQNGEIWGRGALDCIGLLVKQLRANIDLDRTRKKLRGSLIITATAEEEVERI